MKFLSLDQIRKLHQKKYRQEFGVVFVEGEHLVSELEKTTFTDCEIIHTDRQKVKTRFNTRLIDESQYLKISDVKTPQGVGALIPIENFKRYSNGKIVFLNEIQDPGNLGTIIRTLAWFGGFQLWLSVGSVDPYNSKVLRSTMGAIFHVPIRQNVDISELSSIKSIACLDLNGKKISEPNFKEYECYLFGNEARGIEDHVKEKTNVDIYTISGNGDIESLNLAAAVNMAVYEINR